MNPFEMVVLIVAIVAGASILRSRYGVRRGRNDHPVAGGEDLRMRDEIRQLKERVAVLERIATEKESRSAALEREIEALRDRN